MKRMINKLFTRLFGAKVFRDTVPLEPNRKVHTYTPEGYQGNFNDTYEAIIEWNKELGRYSQDQINRLQIKNKQNESSI